MAEGRPWEITDRTMGEQQKVLTIKQEVLETVKNFLERDPKTITAQELITAKTDINSHRSLAEKHSDVGLPKYLEDAVEKIENHKNSSDLSKMGPVSDNYKRRRIGTHGRFAEQ
jgi:hypothetical protein